MNTKPSKIVTWLLTLLCPGLGHYYVTGKSFLSVVIGCLALSFVLAVSILGIGSLTALAYIVLVAVAASHAGSLIKSVSESDRSFLGAGIVVTGIYVTFALLGGVKSTFFHTFFLPSSSMAPTLLAGDRLLANRIDPKNIKRGDVVAFQSVGDHSGTFIKRVIGLPGDQVKIDDRGRVTLNGKLIRNQNTDAIVVHSDTRDTQNFANSYSLQPEQYFLVGDNRSDSTDSRMYGPVPAGNIEYRIKKVIWSMDTSDSIAIRWDRFLADVQSFRAD